MCPNACELLGKAMVSCPMTDPHLPWQAYRIFLNITISWGQQQEECHRAFTILEFAGNFIDDTLARTLKLPLVFFFYFPGASTPAISHQQVISWAWTGFPRDQTPHVADQGQHLKSPNLQLILGFQQHHNLHIDCLTWSVAAWESQSHIAKAWVWFQSVTPL